MTSLRCARLLCAILLLVPVPLGLLSGCVVTPAPGDWEFQSTAPADEHYRLSMLLTGDGALLPFHVSVPSRGRTGIAYYVSGRHRAPAQFRRDADRFYLFIPHYRSRLTVEYDPESNNAAGVWTRGDSISRNIIGRRISRTEFENRRRFDKWSGAEQYTAPRIDGAYIASMEGRIEPVTLHIEESVGQSVRGSFIDATGDSGPMTGQRYGDQIRLANFDGARAALAHIAIGEGGEVLRGSIRDARSPAKRAFTATQTDATLAHDPFDRIHLRENETRIAHPALDDPDLRGRPVILSLLGSWCPDSSNAAEVLVDLRDRYADTDLAFLTLVFEEARSARAAKASLASFKARHGIDWPVEYAGGRDKQRTAAAFPALDGFEAYPTIIFINRAGAVEAICSGFAGPGTGGAADMIRSEFDRRTRRILASEPGADAAETGR